jgi:D-alanine-D-alanine ligase
VTSKKQAVALVFGGESSEHSVSCATAAGVSNALRESGDYEVIGIGIGRDGRAWLTDLDLSWRLDRGSPEVTASGDEIVWPLGGGAIRVRKVSGEIRELSEVAVVFPLLHGLNGEDGSIQGLLQLCHLPYVGNGVLASAAAMDKSVAKAIFRDAGIPVAPGVSVTRARWVSDPETVFGLIGELGSEELFVKPARSGSSVGVTLVKSRDQLGPAIAEALRHDRVAIVEVRLIGREIECAVLESIDDAEPKVSQPGEIVMHTRDFYDYESKYLDAGAAELLVPTTITESEQQELVRLARRAFRALGCTGLARVDFFLTDQGWYLTEVNTMPGFTPISMYPNLWRVSGKPFPELVTDLVRLGIASGTSPR